MVRRGQPREQLLMVLGRRGPLTQRALAADLRVSPRNITGLVDALVAGGHVTREPHPDDRRATLVTPTAQGAAMIGYFAESGTAFAERLFADLEPRRLDALVADLETVLVRLRAETGQEPPPEAVLPP